MSMHRTFAGIVLLVALSIGMWYGSAATYLNVDEMSASRGGSTLLKDCQESCNAYNGYVNLCPEGIGICTVCSMGTNNIHYTDMAGNNCGANMQTTSRTRTQDCGVLASGSCMGVGNCANLRNSRASCSDPPVVCPQGNCP